MKTARIFIAVLATLVFASICAAQCGQPTKPADTKGSSAASAAEDKIIAGEQQIIDAIKNRKADDFKNLVSQDGWAVGGHGPRKVSDITAELFSADLTFSEYTMTDPKVMMLDNDAAILTYKSSSKATYKGKTESETSFETTIWTNRNGKWMAVFHQSSMSEPETPAADKATKQ